MTPAIRDAVRRHRLEERVRILGRVDEEFLATLYRGADIFVMPNVPVPGDMEGFGVVMLEAGLSGLPILAADLEGIRDVVHPGENGELLPARDAGVWVSAILRARSQGGSRAAAAARARHFTLAHFGWDSIANRMLVGLRAAREAKSVRK
jgi:phosphatidylinositol alpha-1,6-mannosyltransferase